MHVGKKQTIHSAVKCANIDSLNDMISHGANVNEIDENSFTPLHWAANIGALEILQQLLWHKADPTISTENGWTSVHIAAIRGYENCIQSLVERGVNLSSQDKCGQTPAHLASIHGNSNSLMALLRGGASLEYTDIRGWTPLHSASFHGKLGCVQILLKWGLRIEDVDKVGNTAAHLAATEGQLPVLECLVCHVQSPLSLLELPNDHGDTPKSLAERFLKHDIINYIERLKNELTNIRGNNELDQLAFPAHTAAYTGDLVHLRALVESGVIKIDERDEQGCTPLHKAAGQGHAKVVQWLLDNGADPNQKNVIGETAYDVANRFAKIDTIKLLTDGNEMSQNLNQGQFCDNYYKEGEHVPEIILNKEAALGRAEIKVEKFQRLFELAKSDFEQLGGDLMKLNVNDSKTVANKLEHQYLQEKQREIDELQATLEYERIEREKLESQMDDFRREISLLNLQIKKCSCSTEEISSSNFSQDSSEPRMKKCLPPKVAASKQVKRNHLTVKPQKNLKAKKFN